MPDNNTPGKTTIAPDVLLSVARLTTLDVEGVNSLSPLPAGLPTFFNRSTHLADGVRVKISKSFVTVDIYVILENDVNIRQVSRTIQKNVARAITEMVGLKANQVNIHIEDIFIAA